MVPTITKCLLSARELRALHSPPDKLLQNEKKKVPNKGLKKWTSKLLHFHRNPAFITEENISQGTSLQKVFQKYITFLVTTLNL